MPFTQDGTVPDILFVRCVERTPRALDDGNQFSRNTIEPGVSAVIPGIRE